MGGNMTVYETIPTSLETFFVIHSSDFLEPFDFEIINVW